MNKLLNKTTKDSYRNKDKKMNKLLNKTTKDSYRNKNIPSTDVCGLPIKDQHTFLQQLRAMKQIKIFIICF